MLCCRTVELKESWLAMLCMPQVSTNSRKRLTLVSIDFAQVRELATLTSQTLTLPFYGRLFLPLLSNLLGSSVSLLLYLVN